MDDVTPFVGPGLMRAIRLNSPFPLVKDFQVRSSLESRMPSVDVLLDPVLFCQHLGLSQ